MPRRRPSRRTVGSFRAEIAALTEQTAEVVDLRRRNAVQRKQIGKLTLDAEALVADRDRLAALTAKLEVERNDALERARTLNSTNTEQRKALERWLSRFVQTDECALYETTRALCGGVGRFTIQVGAKVWTAPSDVAPKAGGG